MTILRPHLLAGAPAVLLDAYVLRWLSLAVVLAVLLLDSILRWLLERQGTPRRQQRREAIGALCEKRGLLPGRVDLSTSFQVATTSELAHPIFENSFSSPDGGVSAADYWRHEDKPWYAFSLLGFTVPGVNIPYVAVTRRDFPSLSWVWGTYVGLESIDFNEKFGIRAQDRRAAVMLMDEGMMQWLLDCEQVSFEMVGNRVAALVRRRSEPTDQPGLDPLWHRPGRAIQPHSNPRQADPVELELLFKFWDGFVARVPAILRTEFPTPT